MTVVTVDASCAIHYSDRNTSIMTATLSSTDCQEVFEAIGACTLTAFLLDETECADSPRTDYFAVVETSASSGPGIRKRVTHCGSEPWVGFKSRVDALTQKYFGR